MPFSSLSFFYATFHATYKELKLQKINKSKQLRAAFHATYKELKLSLDTSIFGGLFLLFTLPIRNWNTPSLKIRLTSHATYKELKHSYGYFL